MIDLMDLTNMANIRTPEGEDGTLASTVQPSFGLAQTREAFNLSTADGRE